MFITKSLFFVSSLFFVNTTCLTIGFQFPNQRSPNTRGNDAAFHQYSLRLGINMAPRLTVKRTRFIKRRCCFSASHTPTSISTFQLVKILISGDVQVNPEPAKSASYAVERLQKKITDLFSVTFVPAFIISNAAMLNQRILKNRNNSNNDKY